MTRPSAPPLADPQPLAALVRRAPKRVRAKRGGDGLADILADMLAGTGAADLADFLVRPKIRTLLEGIVGHSPFLRTLAERDTPRLARLLASPPQASLNRLIQTMDTGCANSDDENSLKRNLRVARQEAALLIALADIGGVWDFVEVTRALTQFADAAIRAALGFLLRAEIVAGRLAPPDPGDPHNACGVVVLALGKHGACELNYSSDTDIVVIFDPQSAAIVQGVESARTFVRMTQALARLLQERTADGYVLRVDLRLRPDPGSTSVAISINAARDYYESVGQNWERAAMIKARPIAGDLELGRAHLEQLSPFIWRKYFDYAAIADIHAMKRQIHAVRGHAEVAIAGHDVKLGRGGIREIEFFVQTQQLIFGGKRPQLRGPRTLDMLRELVRDNWTSAAAGRELAAAYIFLREVEHRLQMVADEQTQRLPSAAPALERFARFCGFGGAKSFAARLTRHLRNVEKHYARLFESAPGLDSIEGSLVFTGVVDDPDTIATLRKLGFRDPARVVETVRGWHFGRRSAVQSGRAREVLTELVPALLDAFSGSGEPDGALAAFDAALTRMPAAVELMSILKSSRELRELFADVLGGAPRLADVIASSPHVLDAAIDPAQSGARVWPARIDHLLKSATTTEDFLDGAREIAREEKFMIGLRALSRVIEPVAAGYAYSDLASALVEAALKHVETQYQLEYGRIESGRCVVLGMGKLGSREMTAASDLDIILIYDFDAEDSESSGPRKLHPTQYYTRLTQRLVASLTVATRRGTLYDVDMRLRPSGNKGPVATQYRAFVEYQKTEAETWEHMALTRACVIAGDASLARDVQRAIRAALTAPRDLVQLRKDVFHVRQLIADEKGDDNPWDLKLVSGGLIDIEFIAQYLALRHARSHPGILHPSTSKILENAGNLHFISDSDADILRESHALLSAITQVLRLAINGPFKPETATSGVLRRIAAVAAYPDFATLSRELTAIRTRVRAVFNRLLA